MVLPELRPAIESDRLFIFETYKATLREHVEWAWGWNESFQRDGFWTHHPLSEFQVISAAEANAGAMHVELGESWNFVRMIFLLPAYQRQGFGSALLRREVDRARNEGKSLDLKVVKSNPAKLLYDRLGFVVVEENDATYHMRLV
jgi:ribosomal protein S18 acetylase RimI-like enzyme